MIKYLLWRLAFFKTADGNATVEDIQLDGFLMAHYGQIFPDDAPNSMSTLSTILAAIHLLFLPLIHV